MERRFVVILSFFMMVNAMAQHDEQIIVKPICKIQITTMNSNMLKGLMLKTYDSVLVIYPGKRKEWNRNKEYRVAVYSYTKIKKIIVKRNGRVMKGIAIGTSIGALPIFAAQSKNEKAGLADFSAITIPAGMIAGAVLVLVPNENFLSMPASLYFMHFKIKFNDSSFFSRSTGFVFR